MKYTEYIESAKRHSESCKVILEKIETSENKPEKYSEIKNLTLNLFYLAGYIIECALKYQTLLSFEHDENTDVSKESCIEIGIDYHKKIKIHKYEVLRELIESKISGFTHLHNNDSEINELIEKWDPQYRYVNDSMKVDSVTKFYKHANSILRKF